MKRSTTKATMAVLFTALAATAAFTQNAPLGDYARQVRKQKQGQAPPVKNYDNDTIPRNDKLSVVGQAQAENQDAGAQVNGEAAAEAAKAGPGKSESTETAPSAEKQNSAPQAASAEEKKSHADEQGDKEKEFKDWKDKIQAQQAQVDELAKDLDLTNREYRLRAAAFYADAGNRLRNAGQWDKDDAQFKQQIADKQKKLDDAKQALEDLREQARKAGLPSSLRE